MSVSIAGLNLHCGLDRHGCPYPVTAAVSALGAAVVLLQENWRPRGTAGLARQAAGVAGYEYVAEVDIVPDIPLEGLNIVRGPVPAETGAWGLAVLSRLPIRSATTIALGAAPGDVAGPRAAQVVEIATDEGILRVVNVHLTHRLAHGPAQLRRLLTALQAEEGGRRAEEQGAARLRRDAGRGDLPTVIGGDFNMCRPTVYLARGYRPAVRGRTWPAHRPVAQLDHLLTGPGLSAAHSIVAARPLPAGGSDHLPVRTVLSPTGVRSRDLLTAGTRY